MYLRELWKLAYIYTSLLKNSGIFLCKEVATSKYLINLEEWFRKYFELDKKKKQQQQKHVSAVPQRIAAFLMKCRIENSNLKINRRTKTNMQAWIHLH